MAVQLQVPRESFVAFPPIPEAVSPFFWIGEPSSPKSGAIDSPDFVAPLFQPLLELFLDKLSSLLVLWHLLGVTFIFYLVFQSGTLFIDIIFLLQKLFVLFVPSPSQTKAIIAVDHSCYSPCQEHEEHGRNWLQCQRQGQLEFPKGVMLNDPDFAQGCSLAATFPGLSSIQFLTYPFAFLTAIFLMKPATISEGENPFSLRCPPGEVSVGRFYLIGRFRRCCSKSPPKATMYLLTDYQRYALSTMYILRSLFWFS